MKRKIRMKFVIAVLAGSISAAGCKQETVQLAAQSDTSKTTRTQAVNANGICWLEAKGV